ncbi:hypothetical protein PFH44_21815 [Raoultella sp. Ech2A]|nr:hypothetical protein [Raoultella sp. Ech2A]
MLPGLPLRGARNSDSGSPLSKMVFGFAIKEKLFYKSVMRVHPLFAFLPLPGQGWQK